MRSAKPSSPTRHAHVLLAIYLLGVAVLMFAPVPDTGVSLPRSTDKLVHVIVFFGLGGVWYWDRHGTGRAPAVWVGVTCAVVAGLVEVVQAVLPYRSGDQWDAVAGVLGALAGVALARGILRSARARTGTVFPGSSPDAKPRP